MFHVTFRFFIITNSKIALATSSFHLQEKFFSGHTQFLNRASSMKLYSVCCVATVAVLTKFEHNIASISGVAA